jgi:chromosome segregation ATPase
VKELRAVVHQLTGDLRTKKQTQFDISSKMDALKMEKSEITEQISQNQIVSGQLKVELVRLQSRIVGDPKQLIQNIKDMNATLKRDKQDIFQSERKERELNQKLETLELVYMDLNESSSLLQDAVQVTREKQEKEQSHRKDLDSLRKKEDLVKELDVLFSQLEKQQKQGEEKQKRLKDHENVRKEQYRSKMDGLEKELQVVKNGHSQSLQEQNRVDGIVSGLEQNVSVF